MNNQADLFDAKMGHQPAPPILIDSAGVVEYIYAECISAER